MQAVVALDPEQRDAIRINPLLDLTTIECYFSNIVNIVTFHNPTPAQRLFLSWAHDDIRLKTSLMGFLRPNLKILNGTHLLLWEDRDIRVGTEWNNTIRERVATCDIGVHLLSPSFLASDYIVREEVPPFFGLRATKPGIPVGLSPVSLYGSRVNTAGLSDYQVFLWRGRFYSELTSQQKPEFARELAHAIHDRLVGADPWNPRS